MELPRSVRCLLILWLFINLFQFTTVIHEFGHFLLASILKCRIYSTELVNISFEYIFLRMEGRFVYECAENLRNIAVAMGGLIISAFIIIPLYFLPSPYKYFSGMALGMELSGIFQDIKVAVSLVYPSALISETAGGAVVILGYIIFIISTILFFLEYE